MEKYGPEKDTFHAILNYMKLSPAQSRPFEREYRSLECSDDKEVLPYFCFGYVLEDHTKTSHFCLTRK